jgi:hypothetical protein
MIKIALFASGPGETTRRIISLFNEGNRINVHTVVSDNFDDGLKAYLEQAGVALELVDAEYFQDPGHALAAELEQKGIEYILVDNFALSIPEDVAKSFGDRVIVVNTPDEGVREVMAILNSTRPQPSLEKRGPSLEKRETVQPPKTPDEEWAETLHMNFDPAQAASVPPPVPPVSNMSQTPPPIPVSPAAPAAPVQEPMPPTQLIWSVLATIFCCFIPGIVAIIYSSSVSSRYMQGDIEGARRASRNAEIWIIVSFVLGVLSATLYIPIMMITP